MTQPCFFHQDLESFSAALKEKKCPPFRIKQIEDWVWRKGVTSPQDMLNLPKNLREAFTVHSMACDLRLQSSDGTIKRRLTLQNGEQIESVSIPIQGQWSLCVSSQTGCAMGCRFCATGLKKKFRNLSGREIAEQVLWHWQDVGEKPSRIVFMGMGEPLSNRKGIEEALNYMTEEMSLSSRRLTVSTVGMIDGIEWLSTRRPAVNLALSLHSAVDESRRDLVPTARSSVAELIDTCQRYRETTGRDVTFEVVLLSGVNDDVEHAEALARVAKRGFHVNLIPYNPGGAGDFQSPRPEDLRRFCDVLKQEKIVYTCRTPRGQDINAACGELTVIPQTT